MAANWHIVLPYKIAFEDNAEMNEKFEHIYKGAFEFESSREYTREIAMPMGGKNLTFHHREKQYQLSKSMLRDEFLAFYRYFIQEFITLYYTDDRAFHSNLFESDILNRFLRKMEGMTEKGFDIDLKEEIEELEDNYFLHFDLLYPSIVYEGYPLPVRAHSRMDTICLLHSYEKMNLSVKETVALHNFVEHIKKTAAHKFKLANYLFVAGY